MPLGVPPQRKRADRLRRPTATPAPVGHSDPEGPRTAEAAGAGDVSARRSETGIAEGECPAQPGRRPTIRLD